MQGEYGGCGPRLCGFGCSTYLHSCPANFAKFLSEQAEPGRQWKVKNPSQPNQGRRLTDSPRSVQGYSSGQNQLVQTLVERAPLPRMLISQAYMRCRVGLASGGWGL